MEILIISDLKRHTIMLRVRSYSDARFNRWFMGGDSLRVIETYIVQDQCNALILEPYNQPVGSITIDDHQNNSRVMLIIPYADRACRRNVFANCMSDKRRKRERDHDFRKHHRR